MAFRWGDVLGSQKKVCFFAENGFEDAPPAFDGTNFFPSDSSALLLGKRNELLKAPRLQKKDSIGQHPFEGKAILGEGPAIEAFREMTLRI